MFRPKLALNLFAGTIGLLALVQTVIVPLYRLLHLGVREHGSFGEDTDFYYSIVAISLVKFGEALGVAFCVIGMTGAFTTVLGFSVGKERREWARTWFWYVPAFWFFLEMVGRLQVQLWYANRGVLFPTLSFLRDFAPHLWWLVMVVLVTAPAILTGRGLYSLVPLLKDHSPPPQP